MVECKPCKRHERGSELKNVLQNPHMESVGTVVHLGTCLDIALVISVLNQCNDFQSQEHRTAAKRNLPYLK